jgi:predicted regulator of Ras-like GTPase activity (Roadblock/LC7/MglB family)
LKPGNFDALRGMGFRYLEQGSMAKARQHLERAELIRPGDPTVQEALRVLRDRMEAEGKTAAPAKPAAPPSSAARMEIAPPAATRRFEMEPPSAPAPAAVRPTAARPPVAATPPPAAAPPARTAAPPARATVPAGPPPDPSRIFDTLLQAGPILGALLLDTNGLVLAGSLSWETGEADGLGAIIGSAIAEAARTAEHLSLGQWTGILMETASAVLHVSPLGTEGIVVVAAKREAPTGWVMRSASHAAALARQFMEAYA